MKPSAGRGKVDRLLQKGSSGYLPMMKARSRQCSTNRRNRLTLQFLVKPFPKVIGKKSLGFDFNQNTNQYFEYCIASVAHALATETDFAFKIQLTKSRDYTYRQRQ